MQDSDNNVKKERKGVKKERRWVMLKQEDSAKVDKVAELRWDDNGSAALRWIMRLGFEHPEVQALLKQEAVTEDQA